ncbi:MAG: YqiA/YcfP family alpha/beta fold hydrolase [Burkholderiaceae bacterium]
MGASNMQVIYVHGFRSSPASGKARTLATWLAAQHVAFACPAARACRATSANA